MKYFEYRKENEKLMILLHGGGVCYLGAGPSAKALAKDFHVVLVAYDGFNPTEPDTEFVSVMYEAKRLGDYIVKHCGGKIDVLYALSYGCRVLLEVLADERLTITTAIADGMSTHEYPKIKSKLGKDIYCFFFTGLFYVVMGKSGPRRKKWQEAGHAFTYRVFTHVGHGGLAGEHTMELVEEVKKAHAMSFAGNEE